MTDYATWIPEYDGHEPPHWVDGMKWDVAPYNGWSVVEKLPFLPSWLVGVHYHVPVEAIAKKEQIMTQKISPEAMQFVVKWHQALDLDDFGCQILAKAIDELLENKK